MSDALRVCLVGCGRMGTTIDDEIRARMEQASAVSGTMNLPYSHAAAITAARGLELVAVSDVDTERVEEARRRYRVPRGYRDYRTMIEQERPDIVSIATRPATHREITVFAAEHGVRGVYCEKPLSGSMEEADAMAAACEAHDVKFNYGTQRRYTPVYQEVRSFLDRGELGEIDCIVAYCGSGSAQWGHTHTTDMLLYLAGDPEVDFVQGTLGTDTSFTENRVASDPSITLGYVRFSNGVHAYLVAGTGWEIEVSGSKGKIRTYADGASVSWRRAGTHGELESVPFPDVKGASGTVRGFEDLAESIRTGREPVGGIRVARRSQEMVLAMVESHRQGGKRIALPMENRSLYVGRPDW